MLALALDLGPPNHLVADDAGLAGTRPEPRDQAFLARHLAALELLPYRYSDAIEVHGPPPPACFLRESRLANAVPTTRSCYPSRDDSNDHARVLLRGTGAVRDRLGPRAGAGARRGAPARASRGHLRHRSPHLPGPSGPPR